MDPDLSAPPPRGSRRRVDLSATIAEQVQRLSDLEEHLATLSGPAGRDQPAEDGDTGHDRSPAPQAGIEATTPARRWRRPTRK